VGGGWGFFRFFLCSQYVPFNMIPMGSHQVPNVFPKGVLSSIFPLFPMCSLQDPNGFPSGSQYVPQHVFSSTSLLFIPCALGKCCCHFTYMTGSKERYVILHNRTFYFGEPPKFSIFFLSDDGLIKLAGCNNYFLFFIFYYIIIIIKLYLGGTSSN
jgi:hypothetical protein